MRPFSMHPREHAHAPAWHDGPQLAPAPEWHDPPPRIEAPERVFARPAREIALHSDHPDKPRRLMVTLTPEEYEMLGIIGVKKDVTRHQLLRIAFDEYLVQLVEEFGEGAIASPMAVPATRPASAVGCVRAVSRNTGLLHYPPKRIRSPISQPFS